MTTIKLKNGSGAPTSGDLAQGEPALDLTNKRLYTEDSGGTVIEVGTNPGVDVTFADNRKAVFGAGSDLQIYHDGLGSYIDDVGTGNLFVRADSLQLRRADGSQLYLAANTGAEVALYHAGNAKLATTSTGIDVTGNATFDDNGKALFGAGSDLQIYHDGANSYIQNVTNSLIIQNDSDDKQVIIKSDNGSGGVADYFRANGTTGEALLYHYGSSKLATSSTGIDVTGNASFADNGKAVFGASSDLQIYHDGTHSNIKESGAGDLQIFGDNVNIYNAAGSQNLINLTSGGANTLFYAGSAKLATTATGIDVTGTAVTDNAVISGYMDFQTGGANKGNIYTDASTMIINTQGTNTTLNTNGGNVGIGMTPSKLLDIQATDNLALRFYNSTSFKAGLEVVTTADDMISGSAIDDLAIRSQANMLFSTGGNSRRMTIDSSGNVGIGVISPQGPLHVYGSEYAYLGPNVAGLTPDSATGGIAIGWNKSSGQGESIIAFNKGAGATGGLVFANNDGGNYDEHMRILSTGGITFNGDTAQANALDDYEEGTFTLTISSASFTISSQTNTYTKIGNTVSIRGRITFSAVLTNGSSVVFTGAPFTCTNSMHGVGVARETTTSGDIFTAQLSAGTATFALTSMDGITVGSNQVLLANKNYDYQITYQV